MLSTAEFAHQIDPERDTQAIAEAIRQKLQPLGIDHLLVEVAIVDSSLDLQIRTNSAVDKEKLLALLDGELQNLRIKSVAKFRIHCWRNDEEIHEQHLLWTEQFMIDSSRSLSKLPSTRFDHSDDLHQAIAADTRLPEPQLSKNSVLQEAINKIAPAYPSAKQHLVAIEQPEVEIKSVENSLPNLSNQNKISAPVLTPTNNYWQFLLLAASIILLGLGIGASVRALTIKANHVATNNLESQPTASPSLQAQVESTPRPRNEADIQVSAKPEASRTTAQVTPSATPESPRDIPIALKSNESSDAGKITLEKFNIVQQGMTVEEVEKIFGVAGRVIAENNDGTTIGMVYSWKNPEGSNAIIEFKDGQVVAKAQAGL
ncbi:MAG: hypothetical protein DCE90_16475 [Pseudanabaena sp.]|nr:MAG: hypothetical protein DCE90_16475 [Pseudanabaena sp.]